MSEVEWASRNVPHQQVNHESTAEIEGLLLKVEAVDGLGFCWAVRGYLADHYLEAYAYYAKSVEEAQAAAVAAARRLIELGARGQR